MPASCWLRVGAMPDPDPLAEYAALFEPRTVAVIGASSSGTGPANNFIRHLKAMGFTGAIYPIHREATEIEGLPVCRSLAETPEPVDYAYVAVAAERVADALAPGLGRTRFAQVITSGFAESEGGRALEAELLAVVRAAGIRLIGPNCLGTHSPRGRLTFVDRAAAEPGAVGVLSQSGGLAADILRRGQVRGVRYSGLVSVGNCADVGVNDLLGFLLADPHTRVIGLYLENAASGRALFELLRSAGARKPVVILKGGRTQQGQQVAASHTGALATDYRLWTALARQTGTVLVESLDEFIDALLAFQCLQLNPDEPTERIVLFGNGGGTSVLATDHFAERGFEVPRFGAQCIAQLAALGLPAGSIIANPIDVPANALRRESGRVAEAILDAIYRHGQPHAIVMHVNMTVILGYRNVDMLGNLIDAAIDASTRHRGRAHFALVLRSDGEREVEDAKLEARAYALAAGMPVFDEPADAANALAAIRTVERFRRRGS